MDTNILSAFTVEPQEVTDAFDALARLTQKRLQGLATFSPLVVGFYPVKNKIATIPLISDTLDIVWENPTLQQALFNKAYAELQEEKLTNLALVLPTVMYVFPDKAKLLQKLKKPVEKLTTADYRVLRKLYPKEVEETLAVQFFIDLSGTYHHGYAEILRDKSLSEYAICSKGNLTPIIPMLRSARDKVLC